MYIFLWRYNLPTDLCKTVNFYLNISSFYNWIIDETTDATYCKHPYWGKTTTEEILNTTSSTEINKSNETIINLDDETSKSVELNIYLCTCIITFIISNNLSEMLNTL